MRIKQKGYTITEVIYGIIVLGLLVGWVLNIVKMVHHIDETLTGTEVFRMIGIVVAPLGGVLGWIA